MVSSRKKWVWLVLGLKTSGYVEDNLPWNWGVVDRVLYPEAQEIVGEV